MHSRKFIYCVLVCSLIVCSPATHASNRDPATIVTQSHTYILGVFPFLPPRELEKIFAPFAASIGIALDKKVLFESSDSYRNFMERSDAQNYDVAFVQPFDYVRLADKYNYLPLATRGEKLATVFVVKHDSPINSIADLKGKVLAMPPAVAAVSRLAKSYLRENNLIPDVDVRLTHQRSHASCLQQVLIGAADACSTAPPPIRYMQIKMKVNFKKIARTREIPHALFIAHRRIPEAQRQIILNTILSWSKTESGTKMLLRGWMKPFAPIADKDYDVIRNIISSEGKLKNTQTK